MLNIQKINIGNYQYNRSKVLFLKVASYACLHLFGQNSNIVEYYSILKLLFFVLIYYKM